jgi:hypothetical protein
LILLSLCELRRTGGWTCVPRCRGQCPCSRGELRDGTSRDLLEFCCLAPREQRGLLLVITRIFYQVEGTNTSYTRDCDGGNVCPPPPSTILARGTKSQCFARISTCEQTVGKSLFGHHRRPEIQSKHVERRLIVEVIHEVNRIVTTETPAVMIGSGEGRFR